MIYEKDSYGNEWWSEYDKNNNLIHHRDFEGFEEIFNYDENNNIIYYKDSDSCEEWYKYDENNNEIEITEKEYKEIESRKKEKEYLSRTKCSRFELIDI